MVIVGVDTALRKTGYGVIKITGPNSVEILDCGVIKNSQKLKHSECLRRIAGGVKELIKIFQPESFSIEDAFYSLNHKTTIVLSMARAAVITTVAEHNIPIYNYSPRTAKKSAVGTGAASKEQVAIMMASILKVDVSKIPNDSTDALSLALCHGYLAQNKQLDLISKHQI
jgi:crossover junction endodeoxyribonuclease RuvC